MTSVVQFPLTAFAAIVNLVVYLVFTYFVGYCRGKYNVPAPKVSGHDMFERAYRVQMNTLENLPVVFVSLFLFAAFSGGDFVPGVLGLIFAVGRVVYAVGYLSGPKNRGIGFLVGTLAQFGLLGASTYYVVARLFFA